MIDPNAALVVRTAKVLYDAMPVVNPLEHARNHVQIGGGCKALVGQNRR